MAPRKEVLSLLSLALASVRVHLRGLIFMYFGALIADETLGTQGAVEFLQKLLFDDTAPTLHDTLANLLLEILQSWFVTMQLAFPDEIHQSRATIITEDLAVLVANPRLKQLGDGEPLLKPVAASLLKNIDRLTGIQQLASRSFEALGEDALEKRLTSGCFSFKNLVKFVGNGSSTDALFRAICENCPAISDVDVGDSENVTDESLECLNSCKHLTRVNNTADTRVTAEGLTRLLAESQSLQWVDMQEHELEVLQLLDARALNQPSQLKELRLMDMGQTERDLCLAAKLFPSLRKLFIWNSVIPDPSSLVSLGQLEYFSLILMDNQPLIHRLPAFMEICGAFITTLKVNSRISLPVNVVFQIGALCPNLRHLMLRKNFEHPPVLELEPFVVVQSHAFKTLEYFDINYDSSTVCKNVLRHADNVESLILRDVSWADGDFFAYILTFNSFRRLKHLALGLCHHGEDQTAISETLLEDMITSCEVLKSIQYYSSDECDASKTFIANVELFLKNNNFDVKLSRLPFEDFDTITY